MLCVCFMQPGVSLPGVEMWNAVETRGGRGDAHFGKCSAGSPLARLDWSGSNQRIFPRPFLVRLSCHDLYVFIASLVWSEISRPGAAVSVPTLKLVQHDMRMAISPSSPSCIFLLSSFNLEQRYVFCFVWNFNMLTGCVWLLR